MQYLQRFLSWVEELKRGFSMKVIERKALTRSISEVRLNYLRTLLITCGITSFFVLRPFALLADHCHHEECHRHDVAIPLGIRGCPRLRLRSLAQRG